MAMARWRRSEGGRLWAASTQSAGQADTHREASQRCTVVYKLDSRQTTLGSTCDKQTVVHVDRAYIGLPCRYIVTNIWYYDMHSVGFIP